MTAGHLHSHLHPHSEPSALDDHDLILSSPVSPSISLSISSLSSSRLSPPAYKSSAALPAYHPLPPHRPGHLRLLRFPHPILLFKSRPAHFVFLLGIFFLGYLLGTHSLKSTDHLSRISSYKSLTRLVSPIRKTQIPFLVRLPPPPLESHSSFHQHQLQPARSAHKIPSILHYVFGMAPDFGGKPFGFIHYASIQSAVQILKPDRIYFHYHYLPSGWWFERALEIRGFQPVRVREINEIFGQPVIHFAHKADIVRLEALRDHGGIYLDLDVFVVRNFDPLLDSDVVLGQEARPRPTFARRPGFDAVDDPVGLCNAVILARPFAPFISRWLSSYRTFDHHRWADHSSVMPWALAQKHPDEITILGPRAFFYPLWHEDDLWLVHKTTDWDFDRSGQFVYHAWSSISFSSHLQSLDPDRIHASGGSDRGESSFTYFVRRFIHDPIREQWREAKSNRTLGL